jgi:hypothetical protein
MLLLADITTADTTLPSVAELLEIDFAFRASGRLLMHTQRETRRYSVLYSPSPLARRMGRTADWVIIDEEVPGPNPRWTVVTEWRGSMKGRRVVRGREVECFEYYHSVSAQRRATHIDVAS